MAVLFVSDGAQAQTPRGAPPCAPFLGLARVIEGGAYTGTGIPGAQGGDPGTFSSGGNRSQLVVPYTWGVRLGYSGSGAVGSAQARITSGSVPPWPLIGQALDTPLTFAPAPRWRWAKQVCAFRHRRPLVRIRVPLESTDALWLAFAPSTLKHGPPVAPDRSRASAGCPRWASMVYFAWAARSASSPRASCGFPPTDICNPRYAGLADGACVIRVGLRVSLHRLSANPG